MDSIETSTEEGGISTPLNNQTEQQIRKRPSFIVKRVDENELNNLSSNNLISSSIFQPLSSASSSSSSSSSDDNCEATNTDDFSASFSSNSRKQSIRHSCRLHSSHHQHHHHQQNITQTDEDDRRIINQLCLPYYLWKKRFMDLNECNEKDFASTVMLSFIPNVVKVFVGILYIVFGAIIFQEIDPAIAKESFPDALLFTFTSVTTIGYGSVVPTTKTGTFFCIFYICFGVPTVFLVLSNFSEMIAEVYWIIIAMFKDEQEPETTHPHQLPVFVAMLLILGHSAIGSLLFSWLMPELDYVDTFYFSFISITTIGFGDISPKTSSLWEAIIIIGYLSCGIIILSAFIQSLTVVIRRIHYIGRSFEGAEYVEVYFGGSKFTIAELLEIVSEQFNVTPNQLREVIQELDELINIAVKDPCMEPLNGPQGEEITMPSSRENQKSISISIASRQTNYTSRFSDVEQAKLIQAVGTMAHYSTSGKKSFRSVAPSLMQHGNCRTISNPVNHYQHASLSNAFQQKRSMSTFETYNQINYLPQYFG